MNVLTDSIAVRKKLGELFRWDIAGALDRAAA